MKKTYPSIPNCNWFCKSKLPLAHCLNFQGLEYFSSLWTIMNHARGSVTFLHQSALALWFYYIERMVWNDCTFLRFFFQLHWYVFMPPFQSHVFFTNKSNIFHSNSMWTNWSITRTISCIFLSFFFGKSILSCPRLKIINKWGSFRNNLNFD